MNTPTNALPMIELTPALKRVTRLGLGGFHQVEISTDYVAQVVDAYEAGGGNYVETARDYGGGASEEKLGRVLEGRRERFVLASKTSAATADDVRRDLEASLAALRTDHLDFYFFHCVDAAKLEQITAPSGALEAFVQAKEEGVIGGMGLSSHFPALYLEAFKRLPLDLILIWLNYLDNLNFPIIPDQVVPEARRRGIAVTAMKPLADGMLYCSVPQAIRYCLGAGADVAVCGANSVEQVRQVVQAVCSGEADGDEREQILREAVELGAYVCRRCGQCPADLMDTFRMEGVFDRQMIDFAPHEGQGNALRRVLSGWFNKREQAKDEFAAAGCDAATLIAAAGDVECPYAIDVVRKARIATAKLTGAKPQLV